MRAARKPVIPFFHPVYNRWTGTPHQHLRERARRLHPPPGAARAAFIAAGGETPKAKPRRKAATKTTEA